MRPVWRACASWLVHASSSNTRKHILATSQARFFCRDGDTEEDSRFSESLLPQEIQSRDRALIICPQKRNAHSSPVFKHGVSWAGGFMNIQDVVKLAQENELRLVRFLSCDNGGIIRGKAT